MGLHNKQSWTWTGLACLDTKIKQTTRVQQQIIILEPCAVCSCCMLALDSTHTYIDKRAGSIPPPAPV